MNATAPIGVENLVSGVVRIPAEIQIASSALTVGLKGDSSSANHNFRRAWQVLFSTRTQPEDVISKDGGGSGDGESIGLEESVASSRSYADRATSQAGTVRSADGHTARPVPSKDEMLVRLGMPTRQQAPVAISAHAGLGTEEKSVRAVPRNGNAGTQKTTSQESSRSVSVKRTTTSNGDLSLPSAVDFRVEISPNTPGASAAVAANELPKSHSSLERPNESSEMEPVTPQITAYTRPAAASAGSSQIVATSLPRDWAPRTDISPDPSSPTRPADTKSVACEKTGPATSSVDSEVCDHTPAVASQKSADVTTHEHVPVLQSEIALPDQDLRPSAADPVKQSTIAREPTAIEGTQINLRSNGGSVRTTHSDRSIASASGINATTFTNQPEGSPATVPIPPQTSDRTILETAHRPDHTAESSSAIDAGASQPAARWALAGTHRVEAGFDDPSLGWVAVRAQASAGTIHAAVVPSSAEAAEVISSHLGSLNAHLATEGFPIQQVSLLTPEGGYSQSMAQGNRQQHEQGGHEQPQHSQAGGASSLSHVPQNTPVTESTSSMMPIANMAMHGPQYVSVRV